MRKIIAMGLVGLLITCGLAFTALAGVNVKVGLINTIITPGTKSGWHVETVYSQGDVGLNSKIMLNSMSQPIIYHYDATEHLIGKAIWDGIKWKNQNFGWDASYLGGILSKESTYISRGHLGFMDGVLLYMGDNGGETVDGHNYTGESSIASFIDGTEIIIYQDLTHNALKYAQRPSGDWIIGTVEDNVGGAGNSIATDWGTGTVSAHISYFDSTQYVIKYAEKLYYNTTWSIETIDTVGVNSGYTSIAMNGHNPNIVYYDGASRDLKYARWDGNVWIKETIDSNGDVGQFNSLVLDNNSYAHIAYYDATNQNLKYAHWSGSAWEIETVDSIGDVGKYTSLVQGSNGTVHISYYDVTNGDLKYAKSGPASNPVAPEGLLAIPGDEQVGLNWDPPVSDGGSPITSYKIYYGTSSGSYGAPISTTVTSFNLTNLTNGVNYYFAVSAVNGIGESAKSPEVNATPGNAATVPPAPQNFMTTASDKKVTLTWAAPSSNGGAIITNYKIYRGTSSTGKTVLTILGNVLTYVDNAVSNGQKYYYQVSAVNSVGEGTKSSEASATPSTITIAAPTGLEAVPGNGQVNLSWNSVSGATGYNVYRSPISGSGFDKINTAPISTATYTDTSVSDNGTYYYYVTAMSGTGESSPSDEVSATLSDEGSPTPDLPALTMVLIIVLASLGYAVYKKRK